jgi:FtsZ-binding cell division protein ZapB
MVSLEQVKLLESKVTRAIDYIKTLTEEKDALREKLDFYQKRIDELEVLIHRFKEDQSRIEDGILSALDRLNQFEDALEAKLPKEAKLTTEAKLLSEAKLHAETKHPVEAKASPPPQKKDDVSLSAGSSADESPEKSAEENPTEAENGAELDIF